MECFLCSAHNVFFTIIRGLSIILMSSRDHQSQRSQYDWHDFEPRRWCLAVKRGLGGFLAVSTWHGTQPGRLMVVTASGQWLGIRGCNWVESKYGHFRQLLIAGANHTLSSPSCFQLFTTSGKDTWISSEPGKLLWNSWLLVLSLKRFLPKSNIHYFRDLTTPQEKNHW